MGLKNIKLIFLYTIIVLSLAPNILGIQMFPFIRYQMYELIPNSPNNFKTYVYVAESAFGNRYTMNERHPFFRGAIKRFFINCIYYISDYKSDSIPSLRDSAFNQILLSELKKYNYEVKMKWRNGPIIRQLEIYSKTSGNSKKRNKVKYKLIAKIIDGDSYVIPL